METITLAHGSPEWLAFRKTGIGGSDAAAILGLNPYKTNVELWQEKVGITEPKAISNNEAVAYGKSAEEYLTALFALDYPQYSVHIPKDVVYRRDGFMFASLDGELERIEDGAKGILEIKTAELFGSRRKEQWNDRIPDNYYIQILWYLLVTGRTFAILKAQLKSRQEDGSVYIRTRHYTIDATEEAVKADMEYLLSKAKEFWGYVERREQPPTLLPTL